MPTDTEQQLLDAFVSSGDEGAFEHLVARHIDLVLGCALRMTRDRGLAEEISQNVFTIFARKASKLKASSGLAGWLHKTTLYETKKALRGRSRQQRKMKALAKHAEIEDGAENMEDQILPLIDEAIDDLPVGDRQVLLPHFLEGRTFAEISKQEGKSEGACQKQASRALAKLRTILGRRGVVASMTGISSLLVAESSKATSSGLIATISGGAMTGAASVTAPTLITNAIQTMAYAKTKVAILVTAVAAVPIGVQMKSNSDLQEELSTYQQRETEYIAQAERLVQLEKQVVALSKTSAGIASADGANRNSSSGLGRSNPNALPSAVVASRRSGGAPAGPRAKDTSDPEATGEVIGGLDLSDAAFGSFEEMMENPAMRRLLVAQMEGQIEATYGALLDYLQLGDDLRQRLSKELLDQLLQVGGEEAPDIEAVLALESEHERRLRELLGDEKFDVFQRFEDSSSERDELATFRGSLEDQGLELPIELERQLMGIMFDEQNGPADPTAADPVPDRSLPSDDALLIAEAERIQRGIVSPAVAAAVIEEQRGIQARIRARAAELLTPEQLAIFEGNQESHLDMLRGGFAEMAKERESEGER